MRRVTYIDRILSVVYDRSVVVGRRVRNGGTAHALVGRDNGSWLCMNMQFTTSCLLEVDKWEQEYSLVRQLAPQRAEQQVAAEEHTGLA